MGISDRIERRRLRRATGSSHPRYAQPIWQLSWQHPNALPALVEQPFVKGDMLASTEDRRGWDRLAVVEVLDDELAALGAGRNVYPALACLFDNTIEVDERYRGKLFVGRLRPKDIGVMRVPTSEEAVAETVAHGLRLGRHGVRVALGALINGELCLPDPEAMIVHTTTLDPHNPEPLTIGRAFRDGSEFATIRFS